MALVTVKGWGWATVKDSDSAKGWDWGWAMVSGWDSVKGWDWGWSIGVGLGLGDGVGVGVAVGIAVPHDLEDVPCQCSDVNLATGVFS